jgi:hypothetical protein
MSVLLIAIRRGNSIPTMSRQQATTCGKICKKMRIAQTFWPKSMVTDVPRTGVAVGPSVESPVLVDSSLAKPPFGGKALLSARIWPSFRGNLSMVRAILGLGLVAVFLGLAGCTMCCRCYDRCGPVYDQGCSPCCPSARAGSILEGGGCGGCGDAGMMAKRGANRGDLSGSQRMVAAKDRAAKHPQKPSARAVARAPKSVEEPAADDAETSQPSAGWTARRPAGPSQQ